MAKAEARPRRRHKDTLVRDSVLLVIAIIALVALGMYSQPLVEREPLPPPPSPEDPSVQPPPFAQPPAAAQSQSIIDFDDAYAWTIEIDSQPWAVLRNLIPECAALPDAIFAMVHLNRAANIIECRWTNRFAFVDAAEEKDREAFSNATAHAERLTSLLDACDAETFQAYNAALSRELTAEERIEFIPNKITPVTDVYIIHAACYGPDIANKETDIVFGVWELLDTSTRQSLR